MKNAQKQESPLLNLNKNQYKEGADLALENAENLLDIARLSAEKGYSGIGAAILITSLEELAKAAIVKLKAHEPRLHIQDFEKIFFDHPTKHKFGALLYAREITKSISSLPTKDQNGVVLGLIIIAGFILYISTISDNTTELEANRKRGFYVGFDNEKKSWLAPKQLVTLEGFKTYIQVVEGVFENVKKDLFMDSLSSIHLKKYIDELGDKNIHFKKNFNFPSDHSDESSSV